LVRVRISERFPGLDALLHFAVDVFHLALAGADFDFRIQKAGRPD